MLRRLDLRWRLVMFATWAAAGSFLGSLVATSAFTTLSWLTTATLAPRIVLQRLAIILPFLALFALPQYLTGQVSAAAIIVLKTVAMLLAGLGMTAGAGQAEVLLAARGLGVPMAILQLIVLAERYAFVLYDEFAKMNLARRLRGFRPAFTATAWHTSGQMLGALSVRALHRGERVRAAIASRGGGSGLLCMSGSATTWRDVTGWVLTLAISLGLLTLDWWWTQ
jgi:cobalt/nickel transport system permease protein